MEIIIASEYADPYADAKSELRPAGYILIDGVECANTLRCVHCQAHWVSRHGSNIKRGWCSNCSGHLCGKQECMTRCCHWERWLDEYERQMSRDFRYGL